VCFVNAKAQKRAGLLFHPKARIVDVVLGHLARKLNENMDVLT
jgi:hypothetical protein